MTLSKAILMDHSGSVTKDRWYCNQHDRPMHGQWTSPANAREQYERHVQKYHPELIGKNPRRYVDEP